MKLRVRDPVDCEITKANKPEMKWLKGLLSYSAQWYRKGQYGGRVETYKRSLITGSFFPVGLLQYVQQAAERDEIEVVVEGLLELLPTTGKGTVPGITLRSDQQRMVLEAIKKQRGLLVAPTGSGKTVLLMSILASFPTAKVLILNHSLDIIAQTANELHAHGFNSVCRLGGGGVRDLEGRLAISTRQALVESVKPGADGKEQPPRLKERHKKWFADLDVLLVDECHLWGEEWGQYNTIMRSTVAPVRLGFTATKPKKGHIQLILEGALGPLIDQVTYSEAQDLDILAPVKLELWTVPYRASIAQLGRFSYIHQEGIVANQARNTILVQRAIQFADANETCILFVDKLEHVQTILDTAAMLDFPMEAVHGDVPIATRNKFKDDLLSKKLHCVVATKAWREGLNIPNLGGVILAGGGKTEQALLQAIGRGLRRADGKDKAVVVDILDPYPHLAVHTVQRLSVYVKQGWLR